MIRVGILGFGFMGRMHFNNYKKRKDTQVVAICDANAARIQNPNAGGNIPLEKQDFDLEGVALFTDFDEMLKKQRLHVLSITLPTFLHAEYTCRALAAGVHVLCEKPMSLEVAGCDRMIAAAQETECHLQIAHCVRFFPQYAKAKEIVDSGKYGAVLAASFRRLSAPPTWSQENWLGNVERSGGMELDLHIHDADFVQHLLGRPKAVFAAGHRQEQGGLGHITAQYEYERGVAAMAEGGWMLHPSFGFEMSYVIVLERATLVFDSTRDPQFRICPAEGEAFSPALPEEDGYYYQIDHFLRSIRGEEVPDTISLESSRDSIILIEAERQSAATGQRVELNWA